MLLLDMMLKCAFLLLMVVAELICFEQSLYVHIPARHPSSFPELELPTLLQVLSWHLHELSVILDVATSLSSFPYGIH